MSAGDGWQAELQKGTTKFSTTYAETNTRHKGTNAAVLIHTA